LLLDKQTTMKLPEFTLVSGIGNYAKGTACIMSAAVAYDRMNRGEPIGTATDELECVCPTIRNWMIQANIVRWWRSNKERTAILTPYVPKIIGTKTGEDVMRRRSWVVFDASVQVLLPTVFRLFEQPRMAEKMESLPAVTKETIQTIIPILHKVLARVRFIARARTLDRAITLAIDHARAYSLDQATDLTLAFYLARAIDLARDYSPSFNNKINLANAINFRGKWLAVADKLIAVK